MRKDEKSNKDIVEGVMIIYPGKRLESSIASEILKTFQENGISPKEIRYVPFNDKMGLIYDFGSKVEINKDKLNYMFPNSKLQFKLIKYMQR